MPRNCSVTMTDGRKNMRVITGSARGMVLRTLEGDNVRPTTDKVKEAVFSAIQFEVEGRRVLDLFAGSGQLGIEALSRDAESCVFIDADKISKKQSLLTRQPLCRRIPLLFSE